MKIGCHIAISALDGTSKGQQIINALLLLPEIGANAVQIFLSPRNGASSGRPLNQDEADEIDALLWTAARHSFVLPADKRVPDVKDSLKWEFARNLDRITDQISGPFLMGDLDINIQVHLDSKSLGGSVWIV